MRNSPYSTARPLGPLAGPRQSAFAAGLAALAAAWRRQVRLSAERRRAHEAMHGLMAMSDRELKDMGISRSEIPSIVYGPAGGRRLVFSREP